MSIPITQGLITDKPEDKPFFGLSENGKTLSGRVVRLSQDPLYGYHIKAVAKTLFSCDTIATCSTNSKGEFKLESKESFSINHNLYIEVHRLIENKGFFSQFAPTVFASIPVKGSTKKEAVGSFVVEALEYAKDTAHPLQPKNPSQIRKPDLDWFVGTLAASGWNDILKSFSLKILDDIGIDVSLKSIQHFFGKPKFDLKHDTQTLVEMMTNGIYAPLAFKKGDVDDEWIVNLNWDEYEKDQALNASDLPNVDVILKSKKNQNNDSIGYEIKSIFIQNPKENSFNGYFPDSTLFEKALKVLACVLFVRGESESHLGTGHLESGQYAIASERNFILSPIAKLLEPITRGTLRINDAGATAIFDKVNGVLGIAGLSQKGIDKFLQDSLAYRDYHCKPAAPRFKGDIFAEEKQLFYSTILEGVQSFLKNNKKAIEANWHEVFYFSKDLVENSAAYKPLNGVKLTEWDDASEVDDKDVPERTKSEDGVIHTIRPITQDKDKPAEGDWKRLELALTHMIYLSSYYHNKIHESQEKYALDITFANLAFRDILESDDPYLGVTAEEAIKQLTIGYLLTDFDKNITGKSFLSEPALPKEIKTAFAKRKKTFEKLGIKLETVPTSVYI